MLKLGQVNLDQVSCKCKNLSKSLASARLLQVLNLSKTLTSAKAFARFGYVLKP